MNKKIIDLNDKNQQEILSENKNLLVVFSARWCGPCKMLNPVLEEILNTNGVNTSIAKVDVDTSPGISSIMKIRGVPSIFFFKNGKLLEKFSESASRNNIIKFIKNNE